MIYGGGPDNAKLRDTVWAPKTSTGPEFLGKDVESRQAP